MSGTSVIRAGAPARRETGTWLIFVILQGAWLATVLGATVRLTWPGILAILILAAAHLALSRVPGREAARLALLGAAGSAADSVQSCLGFLSFAAGPWTCLCPPWVAALWIHLGLLARYCFGWLRGRPLLAAAIGALGGPLTYRGGAEIGAATLHAEAWRSYLSLGVVWALALPAAVYLMTPGED